MAKGFASKLPNKKPKANYSVFREDTEEFLAVRIPLPEPDCFLNAWHSHPAKALFLTKSESESLVSEIGKASIVVRIVKTGSKYFVEEID
jgi:hypothetical protein